MPCITLFYLYYTYKKLNVCISYLDLSVAFTRSKSSFLLSFDSEHSCNQPIASLRNQLRSATSPHHSSPPVTHAAWFVSATLCDFVSGRALKVIFFIRTFFYFCKKFLSFLYFLGINFVFLLIIEILNP